MLLTCFQPKDLYPSSNDGELSGNLMNDSKVAKEFGSARDYADVLVRKAFEVSETTILKLRTRGNYLC